MYYRCFFLMLLLLSLTGCFYGLLSCPCQWNGVDGLCRTDLTHWDIHEFKNTKIKLEAPSDAPRIWEEPDSSGLNREVIIFLHTLHPSPFTIGDRKFLIEISIARVPKKNIDDASSALSNTDEYKKANETRQKEMLLPYGIHNQIVKVRGKGVFANNIYYFKNVALPGSEIISMHADYTDIEVDGKFKFENEDDAAIRKIFDSVEPLP